MAINTSGHENTDVDLAIDNYSTSISNNQSGDTNQNVNIVDIICEGPVKGLVSGKAGVYFNDVSAEYAEYAEFTPTIADNYGTITFDGSTTAGGASIGTFSSEITIPDILGNGENSYRTLVLIDYLETPVTVSRVSGSEYLWVATATSGTPFASSGSFNWNKEEGQYDKTRFSIYRTGEDGSIEVYSIGRDSSNNTTTFTFSLNSRYELDTNATYTIRKSRLYPIAETFGTSTTIHVTGNPPAGTYSFRITEVDTEQTLADRINSRAGGSKIDNLTIQSRNGELGQDPVEEVEGVGGTVAIPGDVRLVNLPTLKLISADAADTLNVARIDAAGMPLIDGASSDDFNDDATILTSSSFNLSTTQIPQTDQLRWSIRYSALQTLSLTGGSRRHAYAYYVMEARFKKDASSDFEDWVTCFPKQSTSEDYIIHTGRTNAPVNFDHIMNLEQYKPFVDFEIRLIRVNRHVGLPIEADGTSGGKSNRESWQIAATGSLTNLTAYIKDKFNYPYTALVSSSFSSKQFNSIPKRSYLMEGLFVKVPSNYTPREYSTTLDDSNNPKAVYDGLWGGSFKLRYTDNPAWVFYDIVTNNRYGAGRWISENDIDEYALYRIARYCDDLVDDGKNGVEPRFRANIFLTKATDVYKVLKDMATIFLGILYWQDGKLTPVQDAPQDPVYAFSKANVIDGKFAYESTGSRTRVNQVVVTWNDPTVNYEPVPVIVEDRDSIAKTGRIISQNSVAFGATSEGQAIRYGRWKLWTAQNQTEVVNFKTSIAGHYVKPGDVITIQDADRYGLQYSGRIKSYTAAVPSTSPASITVDRQISYNAGASYTLNTIVTSAAAFWTGTSSLSIPGEDPVQSGGLVKKAYVPGEVVQPALIDNEDKASNAFSDSSFQNPIALVWRPYTYVQQTPVTNNSGTASNVITLSGADTEFDVVPTAGTVWSLTETVTNAELFEQQGDEIRTLGASKEYRVLSLTEDSKSEISISAVEHFNSKYNIVENGYDVAIFTSSQPVEQGDQFVPPPRNLRVEIDSNNVNPGDSIVVEWDAPLSTEENANLVSKYELYHNVSGVSSPLVVSDSRYEFDLVPAGSLEVQVRSVTAKGNRSVLKALRYFVQDFDKNVTRVQEGIPAGIRASSTLVVNSNNELGFEVDPTTVVSVGDEITTARTIDADDNISLVGVQSTPNIDYSVILLGSTIELAYYESAALENLDYWKRIPDGGTYLSSQSNNWSGVAGTASVPASSNLVTGIGTSWKTTLNPRDIILFGSATDLVPYAITAVENGKFKFRAPTDNLFTAKSRVRIDGTSGSTELNGNYYYINNITSTEVIVAEETVGFDYTLSLHSDANATTNSISVTTWTSGGTIRNFPPAAKVISIISDTQILLDRSFEKEVPSSTAIKKRWGVNTAAHSIFGSIKYNSVDEEFELKKNIILDPSLVISRFLNISTSVPALQYEQVSGTVSQIQIPSTLSITVNPIGFRDPVFKVTAVSAGLEGATLDTDWQDPTSGFQYTKEVDTNGQVPYDSGTAQEPKPGQAEQVTVLVAERYNTSDFIEDYGFFVKLKDGAIGIDGKTVRLTADDYSVIYDSQGENPSFTGSDAPTPETTITLTATANFENPLYRFTEAGGTPGNWSTTATYDYTVPTTFPDWANKTRVFEVEAADTPSGWNEVNQTPPPTLSASDSLTIAAVKSGAGGVALVNSNSTHSYTTDADGKITTSTIPNSGTTLELLIGGSVGTYAGATSGAAFGPSNTTLSNGQWYISNVTDTDTDISAGNITGVSNNIVTIAPINVGETDPDIQTIDDNESVTWTITYKSEGQEQSITTTQTLSKSKAGADGTGLIADLTNETHSIPADSDGGNPNFAGATSTLQIFENGSNTVDSWTITTTASSGITFSGNNTKTVTVTGMTVDEGTITFVATKAALSVTAVFTLTKVRAGAAGEKATVYRVISSASVIQANPTNTTHTPSTITFTAQKIVGNAAAITSTEGTLELFRNGSGTAAVTDNSGDRIINNYSIPDNTTSLSVVYTVGGVVVDEETIPVVFDGADGSTPVKGVDYDDGDNGLRTIQGYLYYEKESAGAPAAPSGNTYTFTTGLVSGTGINDAGTTNVWRNSPRTQDPTSSNTHWTVRYYGTEASAGSSTIGVSYSGVVQYTNFDGVVTFSNGTFSEGSTQITTIDGGNISTGTIDADKITIGQTLAQGRTNASRMLLLEDSLKIFEGTTLRVHLGNLSNTTT